MEKDENICKIDNMSRIEIPTILLDELRLESKDDLTIEIDNGFIVLSKKN